jgi:hypothetical protein
MGTENRITAAESTGLRVQKSSGLLSFVRHSARLFLEKLTFKINKKIPQVSPTIHN